MNKMTKSCLSKLEKSIAYDEFKYWFDITGLQRHLKAIGIFSRLCYRDNKSSYLKDIPRTFSYVDEICSHYPELQPLQKLIKEIKIEEKL